ncbi:RNA polymerase sigma factor [Paenibacillus sp. MMS20-IR301]|uniref:RNA polymerase sigma factor n=1 Tax=Paenibacillus sp. MMS20-IR301 TaxID=2895946 RepID=UPI0028E40B05|nr:RNA polymerase sigma factor [Paenibacillus sp. MMS20-IR301]WNS42138.1 RNA polymerase sigma factor [Paenibacillus sp. MMS20-IR301]
MEAKELFEMYKEPVYRVCRYLLSNVTDAEDVCQEVFVKAILADRSEVRNMKAWLIRIAVNESNSLLRRRAKGRDKERSLFLSERRAAYNSVEAAAEQHELTGQFYLMFQQLPVKVREVLILRYSGELSIKETAALLDIPEGTVKSRGNRGLRILRRIMRKSSGQKEGCPPWEQIMKM